MDYIMLAKICIMLLFALIVLDALRKVQAWREFNENYDAIVKNYEKIKDIINSENEYRNGRITLNDYILIYKTKYELLLKFEFIIIITMRLYDEIKEYSLISLNLKEKNNKLLNIYYDIRIIKWKNK